MTLLTVLLIFICLAISVAVSFYQYYYKAKSKNLSILFLAFLRFSSIFLVLLLLINPIVSQKEYQIQKTPLPIMVDNSKSIAFLNQDKISNQITKQLRNNKALQDKFEIQFFNFDTQVTPDKLLDYKGKKTAIDKVFTTLKQLYRNQIYPVILLTDGNQTEGDDYTFLSPPNANIYPIVLGDTLPHLDLKIDQVNTNKYAFLKNQFPVETFISYSGNSPIQANFSIKEGNTTLYTQKISFSGTKKSEQITTLINANSIGTHHYTATVTTTTPEKNKYNNNKNFAVQVLDQRSEIALVASIVHPDLGAIKRALQTNTQRNVTLINPKDISNLQKYNVLVLYQPSATFKPLLEQNKINKINTFVITGMQTDFNLLNEYQSDYVFKMSNKKEDYWASFNTNFTLFSTTNLGFEFYPPLENPFGTITNNKPSTNLLQAKIKNLALDTPLLSYIDNGTNRNAYLFGENIWKWRMESFLKTKNFQDFDLFLDKTIQFLSSTQKRTNLVVENENFYNFGETITINAQYFNKNFEYDPNATLTISIKNKAKKTLKTYDFLKSTANSTASFSDLEPGDYTFIVKEKNTQIQQIGSFKILDFDPEKQFTNADHSKLTQLAQNSQAKTYYASTINQLVSFLQNTDKYKTTQKQIVTKTPLIDWMWGLVLLIILLGTEWLVRKYNGLL